LQPEIKTWLGGARLDSFNATWPFARLTATRELLTLRVVWAGLFEFKPEHVRNLTEFGFIPFLGKGVQIHHHVPDYPARVVFWHFSWSVSWLIEELRRLGYAAV